MSEPNMTCAEVEARLAPFVDGEEPLDVHRAVEAHLAACPPCRALAAAEREGRNLVCDCRAELRGAAPDALRTRCAREIADATRVAPEPAPRSRQAWFGLAPRWTLASFAASLMLAAVAVFALGLNQRVEAFAAGLALDHVKCFSLSGGEQSDATVAEREWQQDRGWAVEIPHTDPGQSLQLVGIRRCLSTDGMTCHVMYRWAGQPLSVYVLPRDMRGRGEVVDAVGHETAVWFNNGRTYAVVAEGHPEGFDRLVSYVKDHTR